MKQEVTAKLRYLRIAPRKTRAVAQLIKGLPVNEAEAQLIASPKRASLPLLKLLRSAMANAQNNHKLDLEKLFVKEIRVDQGPRLKRWMPRARGAVSLIEKKMSHVTLVLGINENLKPPRFKIIEEKKEKPKKEKIKPKAEKKETPKPQEEKEKLKEEKKGLFKIFRRKSI